MPARPFFQQRKMQLARLSEVILATEIAMLFLYLPFIIFDALIFSPPKPSVGELDAA